MKEIEQKLFSYGMTEEALMEKVGLSMKDFLISNFNLLESGVVVLVGPGHNGGDGLVVARELFLDGVDVSLWCPFPIKRSLTKSHLSYCISIGITQLQSEPDVTGNCFWIEAFFGLGQTKPLPKEIGNLFKKREKFTPGKLISLDVPAGICSDTGKTFDTCAARAISTLTVGLIKVGLLQDMALPYVGSLKRIDIGIPSGVLNLLPKDVPLKISSNDIISLKAPQIECNASKYERGRLAVIAGSKKYRGAALLTLQGAIASGTGSVQAFLPKSISKYAWIKVPEVVFEEESNEEIELIKCLKKIKFDRIESLVVGPGIGLSIEKWEDSALILEEFLGLLVLDADALNRISCSQQGWEWFRKRKGPTWITPNPNEFCRLFPEIDISSPINAASLAARISGVGVLLKGANTVIAVPNGPIWQLTNTSSFVARAGLGDVLAGFVGGIGALGMISEGSFDHGLLAVAALIHSYAASECEEGTNAAFVSKKLGKLFKAIQMKKVQFDT
ncbi:NAD(P)HX epimerase [Prochlorococcus sp. SS52]|nr:NAD(P)HX epimerase [Prochlorococcus marinus str. LG]KGG33439.1 NAD(P)HX epimerase [Prochlorococcus marinus str. SS51]KGG37355.1 NAD(P)HX epimerase [Prochlorococcus sp. SS52]